MSVLTLSRAGTEDAPTWRSSIRPRQWWYVAPPAGTSTSIAAEGPWTRNFLHQAIQNGIIESTRLVWSPGMESWAPAGHQDEFAFDFSPPPLPAA